VSHRASARIDTPTILLGFTIQLTGPHGVIEGRAWLIGLVLASALTLLIRPVVTAGLLWRTELTWGERAFIAWTGLKGAVPILLGTSIMAAGVADAHRAYEIIFVVVAFSVIVHGSAVPALARRLGVPLRTVTPRPWTLGVRFEQEPGDLRSVWVRHDLVVWSSRSLTAWRQFGDGFAGHRRSLGGHRLAGCASVWYVAANQVGPLQNSWSIHHTSKPNTAEV